MKNNRKSINLFIYGDSLAFRRNFQPISQEFTYPFKIVEKLENDGYLVNVYVRNLAGALILEIFNLIKRDSQYFGIPESENIKNIALLVFGIVDCSPVPFTYPARQIISKMPFGNYLLSHMALNRAFFQHIFSYSRTNKKKFKYLYSRIIEIFRKYDFIILGSTMVRPQQHIEKRSPGIIKKTEEYSKIIKESGVICVDFQNDALLLSSVDKYILKSDGHHLTEAGHNLLAELIYNALRKNLL